MNFKNMEKISEVYRYLGSDEKSDFYIVNEPDYRSLTIVFGDAEIGEYESYPIYTKKSEQELQGKIRNGIYKNTEISKCYKLYNPKFNIDVSNNVNKLTNKVSKMNTEDVIKEIKFNNKDYTEMTNRVHSNSKILGIDVEYPIKYNNEVIKKKKLKNIEKYKFVSTLSSNNNEYFRKLFNKKEVSTSFDKKIKYWSFEFMNIEYFILTSNKGTTLEVEMPFEKIVKDKVFEKNTIKLVKSLIEDITNKKLENYINDLNNNIDLS